MEQRHTPHPRHQRDVRFVQLFQQLKPVAEFSADSSRVVTADIQSAAFCRTVNGECSNDDVAAWRQGSIQGLEVSLPADFVR